MCCVLVSKWEWLFAFLCNTSMRVKLCACVSNDSWAAADPEWRRKAIEKQMNRGELGEDGFQFAKKENKIDCNE